MVEAMSQPERSRRYRCRLCGTIFNAWLPAAKRPNGALLLGHLGQQHPDQGRPYLNRMRTEDIGTVAAEAFEVVKGASVGSLHTRPRCGS